MQKRLRERAMKRIIIRTNMSEPKRFILLRQLNEAILDDNSKKITRLVKAIEQELNNYEK